VAQHTFASRALVTSRTWPANTPPIITQLRDLKTLGVLRGEAEGKAIHRAIFFAGQMRDGGGASRFELLAEKKGWAGRESLCRCMRSFTRSRLRTLGMTTTIMMPDGGFAWKRS